ncbi:relaxase/mobilization nuclease domain-containing protein [Hymenobacter bucti]|uniref:Relaxase/mobilization nuclease domain-containing protein n=1 Tax=Hymenobacter bucti TaxID=1844114 RepID=A0ABW4QYK1_9BACT
MISRTTIGRSFGGVVRYQFEGRKEQPSDKQAEVLVAVGVRADSAAHMSADFNRGRQLNPNLGQAVWHTSLSFNPDDATKLDSVKMLAIAEGYVQKMGLDKTQYAIIRHHDQPDNQHLHIIANRVSDDGQTIKDGQNFFRSKQALKELIQEHGLTPPQGLRVEKQHPEKLQGAELTKHEIKEALHQALATAPDRPALLATLQAQQISAREFTNRAGEVTGISFEKDGTVFKGSQLGRSYSLAGLDQQLATNQAREQVAQAAALEAAAQAQRQVAAQRAEAERQTAQRRAVQEAERQAAQLAQQQAAQAAKTAELPAVERKWHAEYQQYQARVAQHNVPIQAHNAQVTAYSDYLKAYPDAAGLQTVLQELAATKGLGGLQLALERQGQDLASHARNVVNTFGQEEALRQQAKGLFGLGLGAKAKEATEKLEILTNKGRYVPDNEHRMFAIYTALAAKPAPVPGFEARTYHQPEVVPLSLAAYAAQREAERRAVVLVSEPAHEVHTTGRAEALQMTLKSQGATTQLTHRLDAHGNRLSELLVQYSLQSAELQKVSHTLDWAQGREGYQVQEREGDRAQRQAPGQQAAQQRLDRGESQGYGGRSM